MNIVGIIPVKYEYEDFPGVGLSMINKKTLIRIAYEMAVKSSIFKEVFIVSDHDTIIKHAHTFKANTLKLDSDFNNHTEAVCKAYEKLKVRTQQIDAVMQIHFNEPAFQVDLFEKLVGKTSPEGISCLAYNTIDAEEKVDFGVQSVKVTDDMKIISFTSSDEGKSFDLPGTKCFGQKTLDSILQILDQKSEDQIFNYCIEQNMEINLFISEAKHSQLFTYSDLIKLG